MIFSEEFFNRTPLGDYFYTEAHEDKKLREKLVFHNLQKFQLLWNAQNGERQHGR